jgi:23S rRNA (uracil1939-C5)-methyltransferase
MPPKPGDTLELAIDTLAYGGQGIGRVDGFVVFVRGALPGDLALVEVTRRKSGFAEARLISLVAPSPRRTPFRCDHAPDAGGCEWQTFDYSGQLEFKHRQVVEALAHIGGLDHVTVEPIVGMADPWRYRNKMEYSFGLDGGEPVLGMHRRGSWREVVDVPDCHLAPSSCPSTPRRPISVCCATWSCAAAWRAANCCSTCSSPNVSPRSASWPNASPPSSPTRRLPSRSTRRAPTPRWASGPS